MLKRSWLKRKSGFIKPRKGLKRGKLRVVGDNDTATKKKEIQDLVRLIVCHRDGGCVLRKLRGCSDGAGVVDGKIISNSIIQADHLITRANSATFADTRLIVCLCKGCHLWKKYHEAEYNDLIRHNVIDHKTLQLWDKCEQDRRSHKTYKMDWSMEIVALRKELQLYKRIDEH